MSSPDEFTRRTFLGGGLSAAALVALAGCAPSPRLMAPGSSAVTESQEWCPELALLQPELTAMMTTSESEATAASWCGT